MEITEQMLAAYDRMRDGVKPVDEQIEIATADYLKKKAELGAVRQGDMTDTSYTSQVEMRRADVGQAFNQVRRLIRLKNRLEFATTAAYDDLTAILAIEGVNDINVSDSIIRVHASVSFTYDGVTYDFGDWMVVVKPDHGLLEALELRQGWFKRSISPVYRIEDKFCFGGNLSFVNAYVADRLYPEAVRVALGYIGSVNPGDEHLIPLFFNRLDSSNADPVQRPIRALRP